jgi:predicted transcriptional regulator
MLSNTIIDFIMLEKGILLKPFKALQIRHSFRLRKPNSSMASSTPLPESRFSNIVLGMEVHLTAETEKKLKDLAAQSGRATDEIVEDAMAGYFDEVLQIRETLDSRYDDIKSGRVKLIPGDQVEAYFRQKSNDADRSQSGS